jgi:hypothetical protein
MKFGCMERIIREAIQIEFPLDNMDREEVSSLAKLWNPLLQTLFPLISIIPVPNLLSTPQHCSFETNLETTLFRTN